MIDPDLIDEAMDAAVLKALKRKPQTFEELEERLDLDPSLLRECLYRLTVNLAAAYDYEAQGWHLPLRSRKMTRREAIATLMDAAESWANELTEYIIPADDRDDTDDWVDNMSTTANRKEQVDRIEAAVDLLTPKEKP